MKSMDSPQVGGLNLKHSKTLVFAGCWFSMILHFQCRPTTQTSKRSCSAFITASIWNATCPCACCFCNARWPRVPNARWQCGTFHCAHAGLTASPDVIPRDEHTEHATSCSLFDNPRQCHSTGSFQSTQLCAIRSHTSCIILTNADAGTSPVCAATRTLQKQQFPTINTTGSASAGFDRCNETWRIRSWSLDDSKDNYGGWGETCRDFLALTNNYNKSFNWCCIGVHFLVILMTDLSYILQSSLNILPISTVPLVVHGFFPFAFHGFSCFNHLDDRTLELHLKAWYSKGTEVHWFCLHGAL